MRKSLAILMTALAIASCSRPAPPRQTPYYPVQPGPVQGPTAYGTGLINQKIDAGTKARLQQATASLAQCKAELDAARVTFSPTPDRVNSESCGLKDAGVLGADYGTIARMAPSDVTTTCALAAAISVWRRQSVEPAAREILGSDVVQIDHMGVYACRPVNSQAGNRPSAHSRAAALDFAGVRLRDGRRISVTRDWNTTTPEGRFLHRIRDEACQVFGTTLSPDYNALHYDHLHLEAESGRYCR